MKNESLEKMLKEKMAEIESLQQKIEHESTIIKGHRIRTHELMQKITELELQRQTDYQKVEENEFEMERKTEQLQSNYDQL